MSRLLHRRSRRRQLSVVVVIAVVAAVLWQGVRSAGLQRRISHLTAHYENGAYDEALRLGEQVLKESPSSQVPLAVTGLAAREAGHIERALQLLRQLEFRPADSVHVYKGWLALAEIHQADGHFSDAVSVLQAVLDQVPDDALVIRRLAQIRLATGDHERAVRRLRQLLELGHASPRELMALAGGGREIRRRGRIRRLLRQSPDDRLLILAAARQLIQRNRLQAAIGLLDDALHRDPLDAELLLTRLTVSRDRCPWPVEGLRQAEESSQLWLFVSDQWEASDVARAVEYAERAVDESPFDANANSQLARLLISTGDVQRGQQFLETSEALQELRDLCRRRDAIGSSKAERCVELLRQLGRNQEAIAWCRAELRVSSESSWASTLLQQLLVESASQEAVSSLADISVEATEAGTVEIAVAELIERQRTRQLSNHRSEAGDREPGSSLRFQDVAAECGLQVSFYNGHSASDQGRQMHEFTGGGVGVLDIDNDDWPDLFFPQGADDPHGSGPLLPQFSDRLYRNRRGEQFDDVSEAACISDRDFGQGVAIGDVNNDGFDDIYVANTGLNALWLNQGDGTFVRQSPESGTDAWTISAAIADLNGDSWPDIYDVNYAGGDEVFSMLCDHEGEMRVCGPTDFPPEPDRVWVNDGEGQLTDGAELLGLVEQTGRGMGIVVGDLLQDGQIQIVVANDESANFLYERDNDGRFTDVATLRGLATGGKGELQGSMGIAVGRVTGLSSSDLFITNYYGESNCLHRQTAAGFFPDMIGQSRLDQPGRAMLGFGTQFLDADGDGDDDLFVANGHLDDFRHLQIPYHMRPQIFENFDGQFRELTADAGGYTAVPALGRAVARLDWNRDGRMDLCVTHLDRPVALLQNETTSRDSGIVLTYVGVSQSRDAVGTVMEISASEPGDVAAEPRARFPILAGDGYECSNQRLISSGCGVETTSVLVSDGKTTVKISLDAEDDRLWRIVEGRSRAWWIPR